MTNKHISICFATFTLSLFLFCWSISKIETNDWKETFITRLKLSGELSGIQFESIQFGSILKNYSILHSGIISTVFYYLVFFSEYSKFWYSSNTVFNQEYSEMVTSGESSGLYFFSIANFRDGPRSETF